MLLLGEATAHASERPGAAPLTRICTASAGQSCAKGVADRELVNYLAFGVQCSLQDEMENSGR